MAGGGGMESVLSAVVTAAAVHPDRELTQAERETLGLPVEGESS